jgi:hypothetical protein
MLSSAGKYTGKKIAVLTVLHCAFKFPQPEVLLLCIMYQGSCAVSSRAMVAAGYLEEWGSFFAASVYFAVYPIGWFAFVYHQMMVVLPKEHAAEFNHKNRIWTSVDTGNRKTQKIVERFGDIFTSYRGIRVAQVCVMLTLTQSLVVGLCTGLLVHPSMGTAQAFLVTIAANVVFVVFSNLRPLVHESPSRTIVDNADSLLKMCFGALSLVLVTVGPLVSGDGVIISGEYNGTNNNMTLSSNMALGADAAMNLAMDRTAKSWVNKGVTACAMLAMIMPALLMGWDLFFPVYTAVQALRGSDNDEGHKSEKAEASTDQAGTTQSRTASTTMTKSTLKKMII